KANQAAIGLFGPKLESDSTMLSAIWAEEGESAEQFLARWERSTPAVVRLKLQGKGAVVNSFSICIAAFHREAEKRFAFQLFPEWPSVPAENKGRIVEMNLAHKKKLDCALHLAGTFSFVLITPLARLMGSPSLSF